MRTKQWRAANAAKGILQRRMCETWGMRQVSWYLLDHYNKRLDMRSRQLRVLKRHPFDVR